jgi:hypothetical protein
MVEKMVKQNGQKKMIEVPSPKATAEITGQDDNAFAVMARAIKGMKQAGYSKELIEQYKKAATSGDYDNLLFVTMEYVDDEGTYDEDNWDSGYEGEDFFNDEDD